MSSTSSHSHHPRRLPLTCPSLPSQASTAWILGMAPPPSVSVEPRPTESSLKRRWTSWAPSLVFNTCDVEESKERITAQLTWGTHECLSHWRSPWAEQTSSCGCWWPPWQGNQTRQCPERPPGPSEHQPQSRASCQRGSGSSVTGGIRHSCNNPWLVPDPYPHIFFLYFSAIFIITSRYPFLPDAPVTCSMMRASQVAWNQFTTAS